MERGCHASSTPTRARGLFGVIAVLLFADGCGHSSVTATKLENAMVRTFANLIHVQESILGGPPVDAAALRSSTRCLKVGAPTQTEGGGSWRCTVTWFVPGYVAPVDDVYDVSVTMDGCFTAMADGAESHVGGPTLKTLNGKTVTNLLYAFDGCFDPT